MSTAAQIDLSKFCGRKSSSLDEPFVVRGWRYATDGLVLVRVLAPGEPDSPPPTDRPKNPGLLLPPIDGEWLPWPQVDPCEECSATEKVVCDHCDGNGQCEGCACGMAHTCGWCAGTGKAICKACTEEGSFTKRFGNVELSRRYAYLIALLPNVVYLPQSEASKPVRFKFDGGEGVVIGIY